MNKKLARLKIPKSPTAEPEPPLTSEEELALVDYFNLCAEEYLFHRRGYIDPDAWSAWTAGMRDVFSSDRVRAFWDKEAGTNSYYGLQRQVTAGFPDAA